MRKAVGHPTALFVRVQGSQKILSRFHTKNPKRKMKEPVLKTSIIAAFFLSGIVREASDQMRRYASRKSVATMSAANTHW
jgi:hypothetical protein